MSHTEELCAACTNYPVPTSLAWLIQPSGRQYFLTASWPQLDTNTSFTACVNERKLSSLVCDTFKA